MEPLDCKSWIKTCLGGCRGNKRTDAAHHTINTKRCCISPA
jgi:hypothetical protein